MRERLDERFPGTELDRDVWFPHYLPHWSSLAESSATYDVRDGALHLTIPPGRPLWCADRHEPPLRVSCVQSGHAPGQQPFRHDLEVRERSEPFWGFTPRYGRVGVRMRGVVDAGSMVAFWMSGIEDRPENSGEICVAEIFGDAVQPGSAEVGMGIKAFRDPRLTEDFAAPRLELDVAAFHDYAVDWAPGALAFSVDGVVVRALDQAPGYPVQLMIGVFDFPDRAQDREPGFVPELVVSAVRGEPR